MLMVSLIKLALFLSPKTDTGPMDINSLIICSTVGIILISSGFILLLGLIKEKPKLVFVHLVLSTPSLVYLMCEVVFIGFLEKHFKFFVIVFSALLLCDQLCVLVFFLLVVRKDRTESIENLIIYYEVGCFSNSVSRGSSLDSVSL
ncbi:uncharacterized protein LOC135123198 isoform X2 [Zophobas morio]